MSGRRTSQKSQDRKSTRLNPSHSQISYAVFCLKKKKKETPTSSQSRMRARAVTSVCTGVRAATCWARAATSIVRSWRCQTTAEERWVAVQWTLKRRVIVSRTVGCDEVASDVVMGREARVRHLTRRPGDPREARPRSYRGGGTRASGATAYFFFFKCSAHPGHPPSSPPRPLSI